jgi:hypothetical protein
MAALWATFFVGCSQEAKQVDSEVAVVMKESVNKIAAEAMKQDNALTGHSIGITKLIVDDLEETQTFYQTMFGMKEVRCYDDDLNIFEETIMGFEGGGATLGLFAPNDKVEKPLKKPVAPLVLFTRQNFKHWYKELKMQIIQ